MGTDSPDVEAAFVIAIVIVIAIGGGGSTGRWWSLSLGRTRSVSKELSCHWMDAGGQLVQRPTPACVPHRGLRARIEKSADGGAVTTLGRYVQWRALAFVSRIGVSSMLY